MAEKSADKTSKRKNRAIFIIFPIIVFIGAVTIFFYLRYKKTHVSTDDAYVDGRIHTIASKVPGTVQRLYIKDNQLVKAGDLLLTIDPVDYQVKMSAAAAGLGKEKAKLPQLLKRVATVKKQFAQSIASLNVARSNLKLQKANFNLADVNFKRIEAMLKQDAISKQMYDEAKRNYEVALFQVKAAGDQVKVMEASVETQKAVIGEAEAGIPPQEALVAERAQDLRQARLILSYTRIISPAEGYVTKRTVEVGNQIQPNQPLMAVVPLRQEEIWITANYKETDLTDVKPGQKVEINVDTYPGKLFRGKVDSIMAGTGSIFSLFPPENATGNYVKVVQRIPVKIVINPREDPRHNLRVGMSVTTTILTADENK
jgi:membrane fusion protein (multidrug efflux system)